MLSITLSDALANHKLLQFRNVIVVGLIVLLVVTVFSFSIPAYAKTERYKLGMALELKDEKGEIQEYATLGQPLVVTSKVMPTRSQYADLPYTLITEIRDENGITVYLQFIMHKRLELNEEGYVVTKISWLPDEMGKREIRVMTISNLTNAEILSWYRNIEFDVLDPCDMPTCRVLGDDRSYRELYRSVASSEVGLIKQQVFTGLFTYQEDDPCLAMALKRCTPYKLDNTGVYVGGDNLDEFIGHVRIRDLSLPSFEAENLDEFVGHQVEITGKKFRYATVHGMFEEILPVRIRMVD